MLMIDDNMYKLARMQESLLKVATGDKHSHLESYIKNVTNIDANAFNDLVNLIKDADKYNQTLEDELSYLEKIKIAYDQLLELQHRFKNVCEENGEDNLELSDMSLLNIEYIENRISAINGYLINVKNIDQNKRKLELLNEQLVDEEKKREFLSKKILILERKLREDFLHASIKQVVFGKLQSLDIVTEYEKIGYDVNSLIENEEVLNAKIKNANIQLTEVTEKYETAKVCHSNLFNFDSKNIIEEIEKEFYTSKYKYSMLKILKLLANEVDNYELAKVKRNELVELLNIRGLCLEKLNIKNPLNILEVMGIDSQLEEINTLSDSIETIHIIRSEISEITFKTEEMINQNNDYLISLNDTKEMIKSKVSMNDFDITTFDDIVEEEVKSQEVILNNQVVKVRTIPDNFKHNIAIQKARGVVERICKISINGLKENKPKEEYTPELIISPKEKIHKEEKIESGSHDFVIPKMGISKKEDVIINDEPKVEEIQVLEPVEVVIPSVIEKTEDVNEQVVDNAFEPEENIVIEELSLKIKEEPIIEQEKQTVQIEEEKPVLVETHVEEQPIVEMVNAVDTNIFETTTPFNEPVLFSEKTDNDLGVVNQVPEENVNLVQEEVQLMTEAEPLLPDLNTQVEEKIVNDAAMPDAFWITEQVPESTEEDKTELSFEEQINALLAENNNETVLRKR